MTVFRAELHCHTRWSDGWASPAACVRMASRRGLKILAITDHNTAEGALPFWEDPVQAGVLVIPGEEVSTDLGHVLAFFVKETIPPGPFIEVIAQIREQNALALMAHPYHIPLGNRWRKKRTFKLQAEHMDLLNGFEVENGHNRAEANRLAAGFMSERGLPAIAGSDAHFPFEIGNAVTEITCPDLSYAYVRAAILQGDTTPLPRRFNSYVTYLIVGILNRLSSQHYAYKET